MFIRTYHADLEEGGPAHRRHSRRPHLGEREAGRVQDEEKLVGGGADTVETGDQNLRTNTGLF